METDDKRYDLYVYARDPDNPKDRQFREVRVFRALNAMAVQQNANGVRQCIVRKGIMAIDKGYTPYATLKESARVRLMLHPHQPAKGPSSTPEQSTEPTIAK